MQDNAEKPKREQTFFRWVYPFDNNTRTKDKQNGQLAEIDISPYYLFAVDNIMYNQNIRDIENMIYQKIDDLGIDRNTINDSKRAICPYSNEIIGTLYYCYHEINKVTVTIPMPMSCNWITNNSIYLNGFTLHRKFEQKLHNDKNLEYNSLVIFEQRKGVFRACIYEDIVDVNSILEFNYDDCLGIEEFEKERISHIEFNREFLDNAKINYKTKVRFTGITVDIYPNPTNEQLEAMLCNHIVCCINGEYNHKIKDFLNFHYSNYYGNAVDFIDYVERFILNRFNPKIAKNVKYYDKTIKWVNSQREKLKNINIIDTTKPQTLPIEEQTDNTNKIIGFYNIDDFLEWWSRNQDLAEREYPGTIEKIKNSIKEMGTPHMMALSIQKLPEHFNSWKNEAENLFGITKKKNIALNINVLSTILNSKYSTPIEKEAVESVRDEIIEQLDYWKLEYSKIEATSITIEGENLVLSQREVALLYYYDDLPLVIADAQSIIEGFGFRSPNSGHNFYNEHYVKVRNDELQRYQPKTSIQYLNKIIPLIKTERGIINANKDLQKAIEYKNKFNNKSPLR